MSVANTEQEMARRMARAELIEEHYDREGITRARNVDSFMASYSRPTRFYLMGKLLADIMAGCGPEVSFARMEQANPAAVKTFGPLISAIRDGVMRIEPADTALAKALQENPMVNAIREAAAQED